MRRADHGDALARAAAPVLAAIEADEKRAPRRLRPLFRALRELLFDPDVELDRIRAAAGLAGVEVWLELRREVGQPAWSYVREARLETAARLLLETPLAVTEIGHLVGYDSVSTFRRTLRGFLGMAPSQYRRRARRLLSRADPPPAGADTDEYWRRTLAGELEDGEARALDGYLERLVAGRGRPSPGDGAERWARLRRVVAEALADALERLPLAAQRRLARNGMFFPDGTFFELLSERSRETGRDDPERGVELALVALDALVSSGLFQHDPGYAALAWARLARARWRAGDVMAARRDLERSVRAGEAIVEEGWVASWEAERSRVTAAFQWYQGLPAETLELADYVLAAQRRAVSGDLPRALLLRAELRAAVAALGLGEGPPEEGLRAALADVEEARELIAEWSPEDRLAVFRLWLRILGSLGDRTEVVVALPEARRMAEDLGEAAAGVLAWLEGHGAAAGESFWLRACRGFEASGDELWEARGLVDLIGLCLAEARYRRAATLSSRLLEILDARAASEDDVVALEAMVRGRPEAETLAANLVAAEKVLRRLEWDRRSRRALWLAE